MQSFDEEKQRALDRAFRSLAARAHTEKEIADKLARAGYSERAVACAMETLAKYRLIDDASYAESWVLTRAKRGVRSCAARAYPAKTRRPPSIRSTRTIRSRRRPPSPRSGSKTIPPRKSDASCRRSCGAATATKPRAPRSSARAAIYPTIKCLFSGNFIDGALRICYNMSIV